jgi:hypothetical protein
MFLFGAQYPHKEDNRRAGADSDICDVESGIPDLFALPGLDKKVEKIDDMPAENSVGQVPQDASAHHPQSDLSTDSAKLEMMAEVKNRHQRNGTDPGQNQVVAVEKTPGRPGIAPVNERKKAFYDLTARIQGHHPIHQHLGELIQEKNKPRQEDHPPDQVGFTNPAYFKLFYFPVHANSLI